MNNAQLALSLAVQKNAPVEGSLSVNYVNVLSEADHYLEWLKANNPED